MPQLIQNMVDAFAQLSPSLKLLALFLATTVEYVFPVFPGDTLVMFSGFLHARGAFDFLLLSAAIITGSIFGGWLTFAFGRFLISAQHNFAWAQNLAAKPHFKIFNQWYKKWGYALLLASRFLPGIRSFFFVAAGFGGLSLWRVLLCGTFSALLFNSVLVLLGFKFGTNAETLFSYLQNYTFAIYFLAAFAALVALAYFLKSGKK